MAEPEGKELPKLWHVQTFDPMQQSLNFVHLWTLASDQMEGKIANESIRGSLTASILA
jgi:hypothetical protein